MSIIAFQHSGDWYFGRVEQFSQGSRVVFDRYVNVANPTVHIVSLAQTTTTSTYHSITCASGTPVAIETPTGSIQSIHIAASLPLVSSTSAILYTPSGQPVTTVAAFKYPEGTIGIPQTPTSDLAFFDAGAPIQFSITKVESIQTITQTMDRICGGAILSAANRGAIVAATTGGCFSTPPVRQTKSRKCNTTSKGSKSTCKKGSGASTSTSGSGTMIVGLILVVIIVIIIIAVIAWLRRDTAE